MDKLSRVFDLLPYNKVRYDTKDILATKINGKWSKYSIDEFITTSNAISRGLLSLKIAKDDKVAIMSENRPEWNFCDFGIMQIGATQVPMYPTPQNRFTIKF